MTSDYTIRFNMKTLDGFEPLCDFYMGNNREMALALFAKLEGNEEVCDADILQMDLIENRQGLPADVKIKCCSLTQLGRSCCFIAKELFKYRNLEQG